MQLGTLLSQKPGPACSLKAVTVRFLHEVDGRTHTAEVSAVLAPVSEPDFEAARRFAEDWLLRLDPKSPYRLAAEGEERKPEPLPEEVLERERERTLLFYALRDSDNPLQPLVPQKDYGRFRKGLVRRQVAWLLGVYSAYLDDEYPETAPPRVTQALQRELEEQALGES